MSREWANSTRSSRLPKDWPHRRALVLMRDPTCRLHLDCCTRVSTEADHIVNNDNHDLSNLQGVCHPCHARKTSGESQQARGVGGLRKRPSEGHPGLLPRGGG